MPKYEFTQWASGSPALYRDGEYLELFCSLTDAERTAILRGLNGPNEATARRVAELRSMAADWRRIGPQNLRDLPSTCEMYARDLESQATYLETR
jgi:hypothetical protein